jgi:Mg2+ and Co2+ transporter CorA
VKSEKKMAEEHVTELKFSGNKDEFQMWLFKAEVYAEKFGFGEALSETAKADLADAEAPGVNAQERDTVECNRKAVSFLMSAMPNAQTINMMASAKKDLAWPNGPKAHLMMAYLNEAFDNVTAVESGSQERS